MRIQVVPYNVTWKDEFQAEAVRIRCALGELVVELHHIGSTAIPGIAAKPIIDMILEVHSVEHLDGQGDILAGLGYEALGEFGIAGRQYFRKNDLQGIRTHQVHAFQVDNPEIERHLAFRDYMTAHPEEARRYGELKQDLARQHPDNIQAYMDGKDAYIKQQQKKALTWRRSQRREA
jgi:GrpB-like predicted nucleotidyltransferase (UPF0157 family)